MKTNLVSPTLYRFREKSCTIPDPTRTKSDGDGAKLSARNVMQCPYCVDGDNPGIMKTLANGECFICIQCGQAVISGHRIYRCKRENCATGRQNKNPFECCPLAQNFRKNKNAVVVRGDSGHTTASDSSDFD